MRGRSLAILLTVLFLMGQASAQNGSESLKSWTHYLDDLGINGTIEPLAIPHNWRVGQFSSADQQGGNEDASYGYHRYDGGLYLADLKGPGCVLRIWARNPWGLLHVFLDDSPGPVLIMPFEDLFSGKYDFFRPPLVGHGGGGYYCYVPIPYEKNCRIFVQGDGGDLGYHVTYAEFPEKTELLPFNWVNTTSTFAYFHQWRKQWNTAFNIRFPNLSTERYHKTSHKVWPHKNIQLWIIEGQGTIMEIELSLASVDPDILRKAWLAMYWDGQEEPAVVTPVGGFFGSMDAASGDYGGPTFGREGNRFWCRFPMPFHSRAELRLINTSDQKIDFKYNITWREEPIDTRLSFHARYNEATTQAGVPYTVARVKGSGHFVGCSVAAQREGSFSFLEGDEFILVDDEETVKYWGTGTDDYFNGGAHFETGPFSTPTHGCTVKLEEPVSRFSAYRVHLTDMVPFTKSFQFLLEHGGQNDAPGAAYSSVAYWYQREPHEPAWPVPAVEME